jgi:predicted transcriptional regulator
VRRLQALLPRTNYASRAALLQEALEHFLAFLEDDIAKTEEAIAEVEAGQFASETEVEATFARIRAKARAAGENAGRKSLEDS